MKLSVLHFVPLLAALALAGCVTNPFTGKEVTAADVQSAAVTLCGFRPEIDVAADIITSNGKNAQTAEAIGALICKAVAGGKHTPGRRLGAAAPTVNGVVIRGTFVR